MEGEDYYLSFISPLNNTAFVRDYVLPYEIYDSKGNVREQRLVKGEKYYFKIYNGLGIEYDLEIIFKKIILGLNNEHQLVPTMNQIIEYSCAKDMVYSFGGNFDVYSNGQMQTKVDSCFMKKGQRYYIINNYKEENITISYKINYIKLDENVVAKPYEIYCINLTSYGVFTTPNSEKLTLYDKNGTKIDYSNGYMLPQGNFYIITTEETEIKLEETKHIVNVQLVNENNEEIKTMQLIYGYYFAIELIPTKQGYVFNGWQYENKLITDEQGEGLGRFGYYEDITLTLSWSITDLNIPVGK